MAVSGRCLLFLAKGSFPENDANIIKYSEFYFSFERKKKITLKEDKEI